MATARPAAAAPKADGRASATPILPPKSKAPLFIGLGAAAAIGIGVFVMFSGKKPADKTATPPSTAGLASSTKNSEPAKPQPKPASSTSPSPSPAVSKSSTASVSSPAQFPPGKWVKISSDPDEMSRIGVTYKDSQLQQRDGWLVTKVNPLDLRITKMNASNLGIRVTHKRSGRVALDLARSGSGSRRLEWNLQSGALTLKTPGSGTSDIHRSDRLPEAGIDSVELELAYYQGRFIVRANGNLAVVKGESINDAFPSLYYAEAFRDIEVINLDGLSEAEALKILGVDEKGNDLRQKPAAVASAKSAMAPAPSSASLPISKSSDPKFPPGQWVKVFTKAEDLPENLRKPDSGVKWEDGWIKIEGDTRQVLLLPVEDIDNHAIRVRVRREAIPAGRAAISLKSVDKGRFTLGTPATSSSINKEMQIQRVDDEKTAELARIQRPNPKESGQEDELEFAILGKRLISRIGTTFVRMLELDKPIQKRGPAYISGTEDLRDIEVINLDGLPEAEALRILGVDEKGNDLRALAAQQEQQKAEMAKQADALAAIPELKTLHEQFVKLQAERVTAPFEAEVAKLNAGYVGGIDREIANEKKAGHLDGVIALEAEKKLIADKQPVPAEEDEKATEALKKLRGIYRAAHAKLETTRAENLKALTDPLSIRLKQLESTLTQQNRIDHAKTVREYRENLGKEGSADTPARTSTNGGAAATMNEAGKSARAPLKKFPPGDDRKAAEWALDMGGVIDVLEGKVKRRLQSKADLPKRAFDIVFISIQSDRPTKPVIEFTDLSVLAGLRQLSFLEINGYPVQDDDIEYLASLPELKELHIIKSPSFSGRKLSLLKNAEKLERLNLGNSGQLAAEGIAQISQLSGLTLIVLNDCKVADADLTPLRQLKKLTSLSLYYTPVTLAGWRELKGLPLTKATFVSPPGQADEWCREIASLFPDILSFDLSRREPYPAEDVSAARHFTALSELTISSTYTEDAALAEVATFPKLTKLILRGGSAGPAAKVTDEGIAHLAKLRTLQTLRLENLSEITEQGVIGLKQLKRLELPSSSCPKFDEAAFKKARPDVTVVR